MSMNKDWPFKTFSTQHNGDKKFAVEGKYTVHVLTSNNGIIEIVSVPFY